MKKQIYVGGRLATRPYTRAIFYNRRFRSHGYAVLTFCRYLAILKLHVYRNVERFAAANYGKRDRVAAVGVQ